MRVNNKFEHTKKYEIKCVDQVYNLVKCRISKCHDDYNESFIIFLQNYSEYDRLLDTQKPIKTIKNLFNGMK